MLKQSRRLRAALAATATTAAGGLFALAAPASAELQGPWAPFDKCPVDDPQMLAVTDSGNGCISSVSPHGTFQIGDTVVPTGRTELQFGATGSAIPDVIPPGVLKAEPVRVPGGLLNLMCPGNANIVKQLCDTIADSALNRVTATVELAGSVSEFNLFGPVLGGAIVTLPVKIHLQNPALGPKCYLGSNADPIVLQPEQEPRATGIEFIDDPLGSPAQFIRTTPSPGTLVDDSFEVPGAKGCGLLNPFDRAINNRMGLPSAAGANRLVQEEAVAQIVGNAPDGQALSDAWHNAEVSG